MSDLETRSKRLTNSIMALEALKDYLIQHSELRLEQLLVILDDKGDYFNEEPWETLARWEKKFKDLEKS